MVFALQADTANERSALSAFWLPVSASPVIAGRSMALTFTRLTVCGASPGSATVSCRPATPSSEAQFVASVSSTTRSRLTPSPVTVAPDAVEARLRLIRRSTYPSWPALATTLSRWCPKPGATASRSYVPATSSTVSGIGVAGSVSATGTARASYAPTYTRIGASALSPRGRRVSVALPPRGEAKLGVGSVSPAPLVAASRPIPERANSAQIRSWLAPPKRSRSAVSMLSRMSSMLTWLAACSRNESKTSCDQRRLPGHWSAGDLALRAVELPLRGAEAVPLDQRGADVGSWWRPRSRRRRARRGRRCRSRCRSS